jgi:hypothetical protein
VAVNRRISFQPFPTARPVVAPDASVPVVADAAIGIGDHVIAMLILTLVCSVVLQFLH